MHWDVAYLAFVSFGLQALLSILYKFHGISPRFAVGTFKKLASLAFCCRNLRYPIPEAWSSKKLRWCGPSQVLLCLVYLRAVGTQGPGGQLTPQILADTLTLFHSGTDYAHHIITSSFRFIDLPTALYILWSSRNFAPCHRAKKGKNVSHKLLKSKLFLS